MLNRKTLKSQFRKFHSTGKIDVALAIIALACWSGWMITKVQPLGAEFVYVAVFSGVLLGAVVGHILRANYTSSMARQTVDEANRTMRVMREVRSALNANADNNAKSAVPPIKRNGTDQTIQ